MATDLQPLTRTERVMLLGIARAAVAARIDGHPKPPLPPTTPRLLQPQGAFVTLRLALELRGCIGTITAERPLAEAVAACAIGAATEDPRFPSLEPPELPRVRFEISALGPFVVVRDPSAVVPGRHGVMVGLGPRRGLLLPQVAVEEGWDRETFLAHACRKAGLPPDAWRATARIEIFEAEVFSEADAPEGAEWPDPAGSL